MIERDAVLQLELAIDHLEAVVGDLEILAVIAVWIGNGEGADDGAWGILVDGGVVERKAGLRLVDVGDVDMGRQGFDVAGARGDRDLEVDARLDFEIEADAVA